MQSSKLSLKTKDKLLLKADFDYVRNHGIKFVAHNCLVVIADSPDKKLRCGVICGRKFDKRAVVRNRARRLLWESFRLLKPEIKACHLILIPRKRILQNKQKIVQRDIRYLLKKAQKIIKSQ
ncbi:ribonuclease P protein component [Lentisphaerae bacterium WC36]|nr:ribonuclease P protein component [Lentisphaerae bacterium WC36]